MVRPPDCPVCRKPVPLPAESAQAAFPFCSERCRQVDLFRWYSGKYAVVEPLTPDRLGQELEEAGGLDEDSP